MEFGPQYSTDFICIHKPESSRVIQNYKLVYDYSKSNSISCSSKVSEQLLKMAKPVDD